MPGVEVPGCTNATLDPQIAIAIVAVLGALSHFVVAVLRGAQDFRRANQDTRRPVAVRDDAL
jgi:hypothetical protein